MAIVCYWCSFLKGRMVAYQILRDVLKGYISYCSWCLFKFHFSILPIKVEYMFNLGWAGEVEVINYMMKCDNYKDLRFVRSKYWIGYWLWLKWRFITIPDTPNRSLYPSTDPCWICWFSAIWLHDFWVFVPTGRIRHG